MEAQSLMRPFKPRDGSGGSLAKYGRPAALCCCCCCGGCAALFLLQLLLLAIKAAVAPVQLKQLSVFDAREASSIVGNMSLAVDGPLPGIWWMDQYGNHLDAVPSDYPYYFPLAAPEMLLSTGGAQAVHGLPGQGNQTCYYPVGGAGVSRKASWTYVNSYGQGTSNFWDLLNPVTANAELTGMPFCEVNESFFVIQNKSQPTLTMRKTDWGWDRETIFAPGQANPFMGGVMGRMLSWLWPCAWGVSVDLARTWHYPVFQVVDADGEPTEHMDAFLAYINKAVPCKSSWFSWLGRANQYLRPYVIGGPNFCNEGPGTLLYAPEMPTPPGPTCRPVCDEFEEGAAENP